MTFILMEFPFTLKLTKKKKKHQKNGWKTLTSDEEKVNTVVYKILPETYSSIYKIHQWQK